MNTQLGRPEVVHALKAAIAQSAEQMITFRDYMNICLYNEPGGYYRNEEPKIGKAGDFYTSSSIGTVMGDMVAAFLEKRTRVPDDPDERIHLVEWGGGNGRMALHVLDELRLIAPDLYSRLSYTMIESSSYHRRLQRETLQTHADVLTFMEEQAWFAQPPQDHLYVIANELLDAFPVQRMRYQQEQWQQSYVVWNEDDQTFSEIWRSLQDSRLLDDLQGMNVQWVDGQIAEINTAAAAWIEAVMNRMHSGSLLVIDYGDRQEELYAPHRHNGTLMCYRRHQAHDNPFIYQGEQDVTSHVNFTACKQTASMSGADEVSLQTQREFLLDQGILHKLQNHFDRNPFSDVSKRNRAIRQLLVSDQMSELFKVLIATKKK
ncbi:class I SAM-dependent methyltransferase [Paenibacillus aestuarii]|uniref:Class I SAM-dependent methyltransferase n=1 Tax=Paenibacillus aestuarii TaxID=516965 RepID=A0ABW0KA38_9BACL|nr:SAM-dependent methyltransferase [Paenibacillus aestuarii]